MTSLRKQKLMHFSKKLFMSSIIIFQIAFVMMGCGSNSGGGAAPIMGPVWPMGYGSLGSVSLLNCPTCTASILRPLAVDFVDGTNGNGQVHFSRLQLIVNGAGYIPGMSSTYGIYSGPFALQGQLTVNTRLIDPMMGACAIQPGTYYIQTVTVGSIVMGTFQIPDMMTTAGNIHIRIPQAYLYKNTTTGGTRLYGSIYIVSINGLTCSAAFSDVIN